MKLPYNTIVINDYRFCHNDRQIKSIKMFSRALMFNENEIVIKNRNGDVNKYACDHKNMNKTFF